ncbi:hypothetical protein H257_04477 [Aphanomyces astaci]|uniref:Uncharacterized protein n=1 Tax=Aphanomyces astaci TaxID=112090 RepID=W4GXX9_APHAT|nr:hypothetical protein H257_04477 [Aphanomyces astaci]ETV83879.1 hypothetical protein H257_04477 [Aphanomyces astaci]|eukprot:XP_009827309.1 hypothetical protein H257_04477 [Aphanomyces astaci]
MSPSIQPAGAADKLGDSVAATQATPEHQPQGIDTAYQYLAPQMATAVPVPPPAPCQCCHDTTMGNSRCRANDCFVTWRSPFVFSGIVGFAGMTLCKNLFFLTSTVGVTALTLMTLGKQGIVEVNWKKLEDQFQTTANWTFKVPSKGMQHAMASMRVNDNS